MRYVFRISYDGTHFAGFQRQAKGERTVQSVLEDAAGKIFGGCVRIVGCGRTDAGVHARAHLVQLDGETSVPPARLRECFNRILPPDLKVLASAQAPEGFDVTRVPLEKTYVYRAYAAPCTLPLLARYAAYIERRPDVARMREAAALLIGEHDFAAFCAAGSSAKTTVRTVTALEIRELTQNGYTMYEIEVRGKGFLYNMVRIMAGELFAVGFGKEMGNLEKALAGGSRSLIAKTMPAAGLTLERVDCAVRLFEQEP